MIDKIIFEGYKSFKFETELDLKPITILFGKNSAGKSAIAKLPTLIEGALSQQFSEPFLYINKGVELGSEFRDLFYKRELQGEIKFTLNKEQSSLHVNVVYGLNGPLITYLKVDSDIEKYRFEHQFRNDEDELEKKGFLVSNHAMNEMFKLKVNYLGPFRVKPERIFYINELISPNSIEGDGRKAYHLLVKDETLLKKVSEWYQNNFDGWGLYVNKLGAYYEIRVGRNALENSVNIVDVGQGMSQALPIIVKALSAPDADEILNIYEQPELHLHPAAHGNLAELIATSLKNSNKKYLIETHSKNFILRLRTLIAKGDLQKDDLGLYFIDYDGEEECSKLVKINVDEYGKVDYWPEHIFNESFEETVALKKAQIKGQHGNKN